jgi:Tfp pilus assembly protein PilO
MSMMKRVALFALVGLFVVVTGWYVGFWRSETSHLKAVKVQETQAQNNVSQLEGQLAALRALQREVPAEETAMSKLRQAVPEGPSLDQLLDVVNHAALVAHVGLTAVGTPMPTGWGATAGAQGSASGQGPETMSLSISVNGNNAHLLRFITALDSAPRLFVVDNFSLNNTAQGTTGSTGLSVETYYVTSAAADPASGSNP